MKKWMMMVLLLWLLAGCGGEAQDTPTPPPTLPADQGEVPADPGYPGPPTLTPQPDGYPAPPVPQAPTAYPPQARATPTSTDLVWVLLPAGAQCQEYALDLDSAIKGLEDAGIIVLQGNLTTLPVCEACDICASSEHYRLLINRDDVPMVLEKGWVEDSSQ